jgi:hypothetical protein
MNQPLPQKSLDELRATLKADLENHLAELGNRKSADWPEMRQAIELVDKDPAAFLNTYLKESPDQTSKSVWSITSR